MQTTDTRWSDEEIRVALALAPTGQYGTRIGADLLTETWWDSATKTMTFLTRTRATEPWRVDHTTTVESRILEG